MTSTLCIHWTLFSFPPSTNFWLLPRYSLSPLFVCKSFSFNSMTTIMLVMMLLKIKEMLLSRQDVNILSIDLNIYLLSIDLNIYQFINLPELGRCSHLFCSGCSKLKPNSLLTFLWMKNISIFMWIFFKQLCLLTHGQVNLWGLIRNRQWTAITPFDYHQSSYKLSPWMFSQIYHQLS